MLKFSFANIDKLKVLHYEAVENYVKSLSKEKQDEIYRNVVQLNGYEAFGKERPVDDYDWLKHFILADLETLRAWVMTRPEQLKFSQFKELYGTCFANGNDKYVGTAGTYNAYTLIDKMDVHVCPYCDDEYLDEVEANGKIRRTSEFDHFFPEGDNKYPALAMCFYNLVLSGQVCNRMKLQHEMEANPYQENIENETFLYPDIEIGENMEGKKPEDCKVLLHSKNGMVSNEKVLGLTARYANRSTEAYHLLKRKQQFSDEKIEELVKMGLYESEKQVKDSLFGPSYEEGKFKVIHQKMKKDLVGY